jgi:hypothetical protein
LFETTASINQVNPGKFLLSILGGILIFILKVIGIVLAKALKLCGEILIGIGNELEKKVK